MHVSPRRAAKSCGRNQVLLYDRYKVTPQDTRLKPPTYATQTAALSYNQPFPFFVEPLPCLFYCARCVLLILPNSQLGQCTAHYVAPFVPHAALPLFLAPLPKYIDHGPGTPSSARGLLYVPAPFLLTNHTLLVTPLLGPLTYIQRNNS